MQCVESKVFTGFYKPNLECNARGKKGPGGPGTFKKSPGTFRVSRSCPARTTGPSKSLGPVLSRPVPGPSRDFPGRNSPATIVNTRCLLLQNCLKILETPFFSLKLFPVILSTVHTRLSSRTGPRDIEGPVVLPGQDLETLKVPGLKNWKSPGRMESLVLT